MLHERRREFMKGWDIGAVSVWLCALFLVAGVGVIVGTVRQSWTDALVAVAAWAVLMYIIGFHRALSLLGIGSVAVVAGAIALGAAQLASGQVDQSDVAVSLPFVASHRFPLESMVIAVAVYGGALGLFVGVFALATEPTGPSRGPGSQKVAPLVTAMLLGVLAFLTFSVVAGIAFGTFVAGLIASVFLVVVAFFAFLTMVITYAGASSRIVYSPGSFGRREWSSQGWDRQRADGNALRATAIGASVLAVIQVGLLLLADLFGLGITLSLGITLLAALLLGASLFTPLMIATR